MLARPVTDLPLDEWLSQIKHQVDTHLERFFEIKRERARQLSEPSVQLVDELAAFTLRGGKRTRPAVLVAAHQAVSEDHDITPLLDACAALELLQSYLLVHDDWMDQDDERRGGPAVHKVFEKQHENSHVGATIAVLVGDLGNGFAIELAAGGKLPAERRTAAMQVFWEMQQDVVWGQHLDVLAYPSVELIQRLKTGSYTVRGPLLWGAVLGGAKLTQIDALERYADPVAQAFQTRDDVLGVFGDPRKTGKPAGNDLRAGKRTALIAEAEERLSEAERAPIAKVLGDSKASDQDVAAAMELLQQCGARKAVEERVEAQRQQAIDALASGGLLPAGTRRLTELATKLARRDH